MGDCASEKSRNPPGLRWWRDCGIGLSQLRMEMSSFAAVDEVDGFGLLRSVVFDVLEFEVAVWRCPPYLGS